MDAHRKIEPNQHLHTQPARRPEFAGSQKPEKPFSRNSGIPENPKIPNSKNSGISKIHWKRVGIPVWFRKIPGMIMGLFSRGVLDVQDDICRPGGCLMLPIYDTCVWMHCMTPYNMPALSRAVLIWIVSRMCTALHAVNDAIDLIRGLKGVFSGRASRTTLTTLPYSIPRFMVPRGIEYYGPWFPGVLNTRIWVLNRCQNMPFSGMQ